MRGSVKFAAAAVTSSLVLAACGGGGGTTGAQQSTAGTQQRTTGGSGPHPAAVRVSGSGDWTRFNFDPQRSGVGPADTGITAANVGALGHLAVPIDGVADSSPVEVHAVRVGGRSRDLAIVTTTYGRTIAIDLGTGHKVWEFVPPGLYAYEGSSQITTASPVLAPRRQYVYAASPDGLIHKLRVADGSEIRGSSWPAKITLDPTREKIAGALNLSGPYVVAVTGGYYGDAPTYQGHVALIDRDTGRIAHVWNSLCSDRAYLMQPRSCPASDSAIWARAGAVVERSSGTILVATGNGPFNGSADWGDSVLELSPTATLLRNWTPVNQAELSGGDTDLGSTAPAVLPPVGGRRLAVQGGKQGTLYLLDLDRLNGTSGGASARLGGELQTIAAPGGGEVFSAPAVWSHAGRPYVFVANADGTAAYFLSGGSQPRLSVAWQTGAAGTSPVLAGGLLYVYDMVSGKLNVRDPRSGRLVASLPADPGHWNSPIVIGGRIVLPVGGSTADDATHGIVHIYYVRGR
jgi:hypothetical protein